MHLDLLFDILYPAKRSSVLRVLSAAQLIGLSGHHQSSFEGVWEYSVCIYGVSKYFYGFCSDYYDVKYLFPIMFFENMINHSIESLQQFAKIGHLTFPLPGLHLPQINARRIRVNKII